MSENAPSAVALAIASPIALEPAVKSSHSKHPAGPFQRIVLAPLIALANFSRLTGPASRPSNSAGIALDGNTSTLAPGLTENVEKS